jgi:hypothetical protein
MLETLFDEVQPDNLSMDLLFTNEQGTKELTAIIEPDLLDLDILRSAEEAAHVPWTDGSGHMPFPFPARAEMYDFIISEIQRLSPKTVVSLCAETPEMWELFQKRLGMTGDAFVCNCGPQCVPGMRRLQELGGQRGKP